MDGMGYKSPLLNNQYNGFLGGPSCQLTLYGNGVQCRWYVNTCQRTKISHQMGKGKPSTQKCQAEWDMFVPMEGRYSKYYDIIFLAILCNLYIFGIFECPVQRFSDLQLGYRKVALNHIFWYQLSRHDNILHSHFKEVSVYLTSSHGFI